MKEFNFKIEGNDVDDLLKVVGNKGTEEVEKTNGCFICGSTQTYETHNFGIFDISKGTNVDFTGIQCSNCNTLIGKLK